MPLFVFLAVSPVASRLSQVARARTEEALGHREPTLELEPAAGVSHYVALSVVGAERIPDSPYLTAKNAQETLIKADGIRTRSFMRRSSSSS